MSMTDDAPPARIPRPLDPVEIRVLGALLEKQQATPEYYPLTLNALVAACNQKSNRDPVTELSAGKVEAALDRLRKHVLVWKTGGSRAEKWEQNVEKRWTLDGATKAVMTLLLLRGAQTPGELRARSDRLHAFATLDEVESALAKLAEGLEPLVAELPRAPGQKEARWANLAGGPAEDVAASAVPAPAPANDRFRADRESVLFHSKRMWEAGLVVASAGNVSARVSGHDAVAITPTSISYDVMTADQVVVVSLDSGLPIESDFRPSGELPTHLAVYRSRQDVGAVVHTHAPFVSTLSVLRRPLPPIIDEMMVYFGGTIEVADYAFTGTDDLGANVVGALGDRAGVLLSNHGNLCVGRDLAEALHVALTMESTARIYVESLRTGAPVVLPEGSLRAGRAMYEKRRKRPSR